MGIVSARVRKQVWRKCDGKCAYCGKSVDLKGPQGFQVDHLHPTFWKWTDEKCAEKGVTKGPDTVDNLMPACRRCNKWKTDMLLEDFRAQILKQHQIQIEANTGYKLLVDYGIINLNPVPVVFFFEKMPEFKKLTERTVAAINLKK